MLGKKRSVLPVVRIANCIRLMSELCFCHLEGESERETGYAGPDVMSDTERIQFKFCKVQGWRASGSRECWRRLRPSKYSLICKAIFAYTDSVNPSEFSCGIGETILELRCAIREIIRMYFVYPKLWVLALPKSISIDVLLKCTLISSNIWETERCIQGKPSQVPKSRTIRQSLPSPFIETQQNQWNRMPMPTVWKSTTYILHKS